MGIYLRGGYTAMPQQILDVFDIHILFQQQCGKSVAEIAGMVGYDSASKFAIAFRKIMGMSPLEYRNAIR